MNKYSLAVVSCFALCLAGCGGGSSSSNPSMSGNWVITLSRVANPAPLTYSGFLVQKGNTVTGGVVLGDGCPGVGPVNGTLKGQDLQLYINEFGQDISLTGTFNPIAEGGTAASGQFSKLIGGCSFQSTGNWSAVQIPVVTGAFKGAITSSFIPTSNVTGSISQGANIGSSSSTITATINLDSSSSQTFCPIPSQMSMTGVISGTSLSLFFYDQLGNPLATAPQIGTVTPDGRTVTTTVPLTAPSSTGTCIATPASLTMTLS